MQTLAETIARRFEAEQVARPLARMLNDVPGTYEAITADWLTAVLCRDVPGARVTSFSIADRSDGSSNRGRFHLEYDATGRAAKLLPATVFCKASVTLKNRVMLGLSHSAIGETHFFQKVRCRLDIETPVPIHAAFDPESYGYIVVMKDIGATTHFCNEKSTIDRAEAERLVTTLAKLHSRFYESPELGTSSLPFYSWQDYWRNVTTTMNFQEFCDVAFGVAESVIPPRLFKRRAEIWPATERSVALYDDLPRTLNHCDVHLGNWYKAGNGDMGLTDWQVASIGHWSRDFIYATTTCLSIEDRRRWEEDLLRLYLEEMEKRGVPRVAFDKAWLCVRQQLPSALAFWTITLRPSKGMPPMQPESISYELIRRMTAAMDDYDTLDALG